MHPIPPLNTLSSLQFYHPPHCVHISTRYYLATSYLLYLTVVKIRDFKIKF